MRFRIQYYVALILAAALGCGWVLYRQEPAISSASLAAIALLGLLAVVAEALAFLLPLSASGSIAFIPYFATILVAPSWVSLLAIAGVRVLADSFARRDTLKTL